MFNVHTINCMQYNSWPAWPALKGEGEGRICGARESAWGALIPYSLPFERLRTPATQAIQL